MFSSAIMNMREFLSIAEEFDEFVPKMDRRNLRVAKVLELCRNIEKVRLEISLPKDSTRATKRSVLQQMAWVHFSYHTTVQNPARETMEESVSAGYKEEARK